METQEKKEKAKKYQEEYYSKNKEKLKKSPESRRSWYNKNKGKHKESCKKWREKNPDKVKEMGRRGHLKARHGLTVSAFESMLIGQNNRCAICGTDDWGTERSPLVDHDHKTDEIRGILCYSCNVALGHFKDNTEILRTAICYLEEHMGK